MVQCVQSSAWCVCIHHCSMPISYQQLCQKWFERHYQLFLGNFFFLVFYQITINSNHELVSHLTPHFVTLVCLLLEDAGIELFFLFLAHLLAHLLRLLYQLRAALNHWLFIFEVLWTRSLVIIAELIRMKPKELLLRWRRSLNLRQSDYFTSCTNSKQNEITSELQHQEFQRNATRARTWFGFARARGKIRVTWNDKSANYRSTRC